MPRESETQHKENSDTKDSASLFHFIFFEMDKSDAEVEVAPLMGSSAGEKAPTGKGAAKKATAGKKGTAGMNNTAGEVGKMVEEVNTQEEKQKTP
jgi:hypothetical protein